MQTSDQSATLPAAPRVGRAASRIAIGAIVIANIGRGLYAPSRSHGYAELLLVYWAATVVIGAWNVSRLLIVALFRERIDDLPDLKQAFSRLAAVALMLTYYTAALSGLAMVLFVAVTVLPATLAFQDRAAGHAVSTARAAGDFRLELVALALGMIHGLSFLVNLVFGREFRGGSVLRLATQPFIRCGLIIALILAAVAAAWLFPGVAASTTVPLVVVGVKIWADIHADAAERRRLTP